MKIYNRRNYHYYVVQSYSLSYKCSDFAFDPENPFALVLALTDGSVIRYEWKFSSASSRKLGGSGMFAIIDGNKLLCTPFDKVLVPPPMSFYQIQCKDEILSRDFNKSKMFIWTKFDILVFSLELEQPDPETSNKEIIFGKACLDYGKYPKKVGQYKLNSLSLKDPIVPHHWTVVNEDLVCCVAPSRNESSGKSIFLISLDPNEEVCNVERQIKVDGANSVFDLKSHEDSKGVSSIVLSTTDNRVIQFDLDGNKLQMLAANRPINDIFTFEINSIFNFLGVSRNRFLYINSNLLCSEITSVQLQSKEFILFTTLSHRLYICPLSEVISKSFPLHLEGFYARKIERGAKLAGVVQNGTSVILQMPRGNLECIHPKIMLIRLVEKKLEGNYHSEAFQICQKHRLDMNILCDHDFATFLSSLAQILRNVNSYLLVNLFISELNDKEPEIKFKRKSTG